MSNINIQVFVNWADRTSYVIDYTRSQQICNGVGILDISFIPIILDGLQVYQEIVLWEEGVKKGTYYISKITTNASDKKVTLNCQDKSKRMQDYWLSSLHSTNTSLSTRYWIAKLLDDAGIDYEFDVDEEATGYMNPDTSFGLCSLSDIMTTLLQDSGWYLYFDANGTARIGDLNKDTDDYDYFLDDSHILSIDTVKHDKMLRNRAVCWGGSNPITQEWVYADLRKSTPWDYDSNDLRTWVISNGTVDSVNSAAVLAGKGLKEFSKINYEKAIEFTGAPDVTLGDIVYVDSRFLNAAGLVTTIGSSLSADTGLRSTITLDQRCPRLFAFVGYGNPVYIGTKGQGVWKKPLINYHVWSEFNTGLPYNDRNIIDLAVNASTCICVTDKGNAYIRTQNNYGWVKFNPVGFIGNPDDITTNSIGSLNGVTATKVIPAVPIPLVTYLSSELQAVACDINKQTNEFYIGYKGKKENTNYQSFIVTAKSLTKYTVSLVRDGFNRFYELYDLTTDSKELILSATPYFTNMGEVYYPLTSHVAGIMGGINREELINGIPSGTTINNIIDSSLISTSSLVATTVFWDKYAYFWHAAIIDGHTHYFATQYDMENQVGTYVDTYTFFTTYVGSALPWSFAVDTNGHMILTSYRYTTEIPIDTVFVFYSIDFTGETSITVLNSFNVSSIWADYPHHNTDDWIVDTTDDPTGVLGTTYYRWHTMFKLTDKKYMTLIHPKTCEVRGVVIDISTNEVSYLTLAIGDDLTEEPYVPPYAGWAWTTHWTIESQPIIMNDKLYMTFGRGLVTIGGGGG